ncbi:hypothetical protein [Heliorestis convoluta]|uniref:hypothetical protein n=1 Tax=Heliorestis convoluta TaxID=356322 RepID=UPI00129A4EA1|nr:hypothetical protein [Heliorestis convoluta]
MGIRDQIILVPNLKPQEFRVVPVTTDSVKTRGVRIVFKKDPLCHYCLDETFCFIAEVYRQPKNILVTRKFFDCIKPPLKELVIPFCETRCEKFTYTVKLFSANCVLPHQKECSC